MENLIKLNPRRQAAQLALTTGLALLFITALLWGLPGVTPAHADPGTLYVDGTTGSDTTDCSNPAEPCATIGYALAQAGNGDEIRVAEGSYLETVDIGITVTLKGGYEATSWTRDIEAHPTIVDANGADASVINVLPGTNVLLEGFTVQGANHSGEGGGFFINGATVVISATIVRDNTAGTWGGGVYAEETSGAVNVSLVSSELLNNDAGIGGGGLSASASLITLDDVKVVSNTTQGEGAGVRAFGTIVITNSAVVSNTAAGCVSGPCSGGGIYANGDLSIYNSEISDNVMDGVSNIYGGGIAVSDGTLHLQGSIVSNNRSVATDFSGGSGLVAFGSDVTIVDTSIISNGIGDNAVGLFSSPFTLTNILVADNDGSGIQSDENPLTGTMMNVTVAANENQGIQMTGGDVRITNSIIWGNSWDNNCIGNCTVAHSDIGTGDTSGTGNISADPRFVDAANGDYHLGVGSPCIDKGTSVGAPATDIEGTPRDAAPDMGAYEWTGFRIFLPLTLKNFGL
jgi:hypothetical protein